MRLRFAGAVGVAVATAACLGEGTVSRFAAGELREGPAVSPSAYRAFLEGAIAEERGDLAAAARGYRSAAEQGPDDPEVWSRLGRVWCTFRPRDADGAFEKALALDPEYEGALARRGECALMRAAATRAASPGPPGAADLAAASRANPGRVELAARAVRWRDDAEPASAFALTVAYPDSSVAWSALADYARARHDPTTEARALLALARLDSAGRTRALDRAADLLSHGEVELGRRLAAAAVDSARRVGPDPRQPAPKLDAARVRAVNVAALDHALLEGEPEMAARRAMVTHLGLEEASARALAFGAPELAGELASRRLGAEPTSTVAALVVALAASDLARRGPGAAPDAPDPALSLGRLPPLSRPLPAALSIELTERLARAGGVEGARRFFAEVHREPVSGADALLVPRVADLAARGIVAPAALPPEARIELAARAGSPVAPGSPDAAVPLDVPHAYLRAALAQPAAPATRALGSAASPTHRAVLTADVLVALASGGPTEALWRRVVAAPREPLVLGSRVALADARGAGEAAAEARALLRPRAMTERERRLVGPDAGSAAAADRSR
ncbi:MAG: hypothetical protein IPF92_05850 [Myxococcales bacterium]|nr:hypothetical protein [Myxococcales bacterium]